MLKLNALGEFENNGEELVKADYRGDAFVRSEAQINSNEIARAIDELPQIAQEYINQKRLEAQQKLEEENLNAYRARVMNSQKINRAIMKEARAENPLAYAKALEQMTTQPMDIRTMSDLNWHGTKMMSGGHFLPSKDFTQIKMGLEYGNGEQGEVVMLPSPSTQVTYIDESQRAEAIAGYTMHGLFDDLLDRAKEGLTSGAGDRLEDEAYKLLNPDTPVAQPITTVKTLTVPGAHPTTTTIMSPVNMKYLAIGAGVVGLALVAIFALKSRRD